MLKVMGGNNKQSKISVILLISWLVLLTTAILFFILHQSEASKETLITVAGAGIVSQLVAGYLIISSFSKRTHSQTTSAKINPGELLESIVDGVVVINQKMQIQVFNRAANEITGWTEINSINLDFRNVLLLVDQDGKTVDDSTNPFLMVLRGSNAIKDNNALLKTHANKLVNISLIVSPIKDKDQTVAAVGIFRDITQEKYEEKQKAEFISTASHEMRTPVAAIEGYLSLTLNDKVAKIDGRAREYLEKAHTTTQHLGELFQDLLTAAKSEDGRLISHPQVIEVGKFLDELTSEARYAAEKKGLILEDTTISSGEQRIEKIRPLAYVYADPNRLREVMTNLFDNAIKYTSQGKITLGLHTEDKEVVLSVSDTGTGIPAEDIPHLFQKFYRVDNSATRQVGGTGLGLFIVRKIIELYSGRVWAESVLNKGSIFYVALPRISAEEAKRLVQVPASPGV